MSKHHHTEFLIADFQNKPDVLQTMSLEVGGEAAALRGLFSVVASNFIVEDLMSQGDLAKPGQVA